MAGGAFGYSFGRLADSVSLVSGGLTLLAEVGKTLEWAASGDTCESCAQARVIRALETYFSDSALDNEAAIAILKGKLQSVSCEKHVTDSKNA